MTTESLTRRFHADQVDKAGRPYVGHLERVVANLLRRWPDATEDEVAAAWLHDALEDTDAMPSDLLDAGIKVSAMWLVRDLTRLGGQPYHSYIGLISRSSRSAIRIKLADLEDNMDPARVAAIPDGPRLLRERYAPARAVLERALRERWG